MTLHLFFLLFFSLWLSTCAAEDLDLALFRPRLSLSGGVSAPSHFESGAGSYSDRDTELGAIFPLWGTRPKELIENGALYQALLGNKVRWFSPEASFLNKKYHALEIVPSLTFLWLTEERNFYVFSLGARIAEDVNNLDHPSVNPVGLFLGGQRISDSAVFQFGLGYVYLYGKGLPLPLVGVSWAIENNWMLKILLPAFIKVELAAGEKLQLNFFLKAKGEQFRLLNENNFAGQPDQVTFRQMQLALGLGAGYALTKDLELASEVGVLGRRTLELRNDSSEFMIRNAKASAYALLKLSFRLGDAPADQIEKALFPHREENAVPSEKIAN